MAEPCPSVLVCLERLVVGKVLGRQAVSHRTVHPLQILLAQRGVDAVRCPVGSCFAKFLARINDGFRYLDWLIWRLSRRNLRKLVRGDQAGRDGLLTRKCNGRGHHCVPECPRWRLTCPRALGGTQASLATASGCRYACKHDLRVQECMICKHGVLCKYDCCVRPSVLREHAPQHVSTQGSADKLQILQTNCRKGRHF